MGYASGTIVAWYGVGGHNANAARTGPIRATRIVHLQLGDDAMKYAFDAFSGTHVWTFGNGIDDVRYTQPVIVSDSPVALPMLANGAKQKIADAAAIPRDTKTGKSATDQEKRDAMQAIVDRLNNGVWNADRTGATKPKPIDVAALVAAIVALRQRPEAAVKAFVDAKTEEQRFALAMSDEFRLEYAMQCVKMRPVVALDDAALAEIDAL